MNWFLLSALLALPVALWYWLQYHNPPPFGAQEVMPKLWLGNFEDSLQVDELRKRNITHVLSVATGLYPHHQSLVTAEAAHSEWAGFEHMVLRGMDKDGQDLLSYFPIVHAFIDEGRKSGGSVLVHCMAGISRSATCLISYIMRAEGLSFEQTLALVQGKRTIVNPNSGFRRQLEVFERHLQQAREKKDEKGEEKRTIEMERTKVGQEDVEYMQAWMSAEIVRWHARDRRFEVVQPHEGGPAERVRWWLRHTATQLWAYHLRRFGKALQRTVRSPSTERPKIA